MNTNDASLRILLVDGHDIVREGLRLWMEPQPDLCIAGEANSGDEALQLLARQAFDVAIIDMRIPGTPALEVIEQIRSHHTACSVLVFTHIAHETHVRAALEAGATGYLLKDASRETLLRAVREIGAGRAWMHPQAQRQVLEWMRRPVSVLDQLTARERNVLDLIAEGMSNKRIARQLDLTEGTVKGYVSQVLDKLNVADRTQAAVRALRERSNEPGTRQVA
jgi:DNA-binding NarL/FixJ family response regulator